jgi:hypothetical protein
MTLRGAALPRMGWRTGMVLLLLVSCAASCGGDGTGPAAADPAAATGAAGSRLAVEERLALLDASPPPLSCAELLTILTQKCRESRSELAEAIIAARRTLAQERGVTVAALDYLRGVDQVVPAGSRDVDCTTVATELGRALGR